MAKFELTIVTPHAENANSDAHNVAAAVKTALHDLLSACGQQTEGAVMGRPTTFEGEQLHLGDWKFTTSVEL